jgi:uncharacterized protein YkwD
LGLISAADLLMSENSRILSVVVLLLGVALVMSARAEADGVTPPERLASVGVTAPTSGELAVVRVINTVRRANGAPALRIGPALTRAARSHSVDMVRRGYFDHGPFVQRLRRFGVRAPYVGENLATGTTPLSAGAIVQMWIASPPHRQNLLDRGFRRIGVGVAGGSTRLVTADFAGG